MSRFRSVAALCVVTACLPLAHAQRRTVTAAEFKAAVAGISRNSAQWRKAVEDVKIDDLPVSYRAGKQYEENKRIVSEDLKLVILWAERLQHEQSLYDEVNFLTNVQELGSQLQQFTALLLDAEVTDKTSADKLVTWTDQLSTLANGPINDLYTTAFLYTTDHARRVDGSCPPRTN